MDQRPNLGGRGFLKMDPCRLPTGVSTKMVLWRTPTLGNLHLNLVFSIQNGWCSDQALDALEKHLDQRVAGQIWRVELGATTQGAEKHLQETSENHGLLQYLWRVQDFSK